MGTGVIITMATISIGSAIAEKILGQMGKQQEAQYCATASSCMLATTTIGCILNAISSLRNL